jgi:processive 1,2-diacylglycerol beta-glucosyltransferase
MGAITKAPQIWDYLYDNPGIAKNIENIKNTIHKLNSPKIKKLFDGFLPDAVVCTQAFPCGMVADFKKTYGSDILLVAALTDYIPHAYWIYDEVNFFIVPSEEVAGRLREKGVAKERMKVFGIPFDPKFNEPVDKNNILLSLNLNLNLPTILIMGGGQGLGPIPTIVRSLEKVKEEIQEIIVAGSNRKLYNSLQRKIKKYKKKILLYSFADNINQLMSISDLIITKPGGITTAEALAKKIPMIIVEPLPGQEMSNTQYLTEKGAAIEVDEPKEINLAVENLLNEPAGLQKMRECAERISKPQASLDIAKLLLAL